MSNKLRATSAMLAVGLASGCAGGPDTIAEVNCSKKNTPNALGQIAYFGFFGQVRDKSEQLSVSDGEQTLVFRYNDGKLEGDLSSSLDSPGEVLATLPTATVYAGAPRLDGRGYNMGVTAITLLCNDVDPRVVYNA